MHSYIMLYIHTNIQCFLLHMNIRTCVPQPNHPYIRTCPQTCLPPARLPACLFARSYTSACFYVYVHLRTSTTQSPVSAVSSSSQLLYVHRQRRDVRGLTALHERHVVSSVSDAHLANLTCLLTCLPAYLPACLPVCL